jgi:hypothetical protein
LQTEDTIVAESDRSIAHGPYDEGNPPPLAFHAWAELSAKLSQRNHEERRDILDGAGVRTEVFDACNAFWLAALADQIARDNYRLARTYANMCVREMESRRATPSAVAGATGAHLPSEDLDETAMLVALPDETALPFRPSGHVDIAPPQPSALNESRAAGETQLPAVRQADATLPFHKGDDGDDQGEGRA